MSKLEPIYQFAGPPAHKRARSSFVLVSSFLVSCCLLFRVSCCLFPVFCCFSMFPVSCSSFHSSTFVCLVARVAAPGTQAARNGTVAEPSGPGKRPFGAHRVNLSAFLVDWKADKKSSFFRIASKRQKSTNRSTLGGFRSIFGPQIVDFEVILALIFRHIFEH